MAYVVMARRDPGSEWPAGHPAGWLQRSKICGSGPCSDMCLDMCLDMCFDMYLDMCLGMYLDMCLDMYLDMRSRLAAVSHRAPPSG